MTRLFLIAAALTLTACNAPAPAATEPATAPETRITPTAASDLPEAVRAAVLAARPGMVIAEAELKEREGRRYYDVEGTLNGQEIELDLLEEAGAWRVVEIQRDIPWTDTPPPVRAAAEEARSGFTPVRVIESRQAEGDVVIYELFADGQPATPALEVKVEGDAVSILGEAWPH